METAESACPGALVLHGAVQHQGQCLGVYMLVEGRTAHGRPVWKHVSQDRCIAKNSNGTWVVQREDGVGVRNPGYMLLRDTTAVLPHQSKAVWKVIDGKGWIPAPLLKCDAQEDFAKKKAQREGSEEGSEDDCPRFVCGTRVDGKDPEEAQISSFVKELQALSSVGAVLAAQDDEGAGGTQDVLASLMAKEVRTGQNGVGGGGKAKRSIILRDTIQAITEHHVLAMAARAGVVKVSPLSFEEIRSVMKVWLEEVIRKTVAIAEHGGRNTILDSDVLSAAIDCVSHEEMKIVCGTGRLAAVYAAQGADRWAGAYQAVDGNLAHPPSPFAQLAADFSSEVTRRATNKLYNNLPNADAADSATVEKEEEEVWWCDEYEMDGGWGGEVKIFKGWWYHNDTCRCENCHKRKVQNATYLAGIAGSRSIGSGRYPSGVPFKTQDEIQGPDQPHGDSLCYIRQMQRYKGPVLPFQPFVRIVAEIADDYRSGVSFCPSALQVLCAMLEDYVHKLFEDAHLIAIQCVKDDGFIYPRELPIIYPRELQLARRLHRQRL